MSELRAMHRRTMNMICRGVIEETDDERDVQQVKISLLKDEGKASVERFQNYGFSSNPPADTEVIAVFPFGGRDHGVIVATDDRSSRFTDLQPGEIAVYTDEGDSIVLNRENKMALSTKDFGLEAEDKLALNTKEATIKGSDSITLDAPTTSVSQDLKVARNVNADVIDAKSGFSLNGVPINIGDGSGGGGSGGGIPLPVSLFNGGTGVSVTSNAALLDAVGAVPTAGGTMSGDLLVHGSVVVGNPLTPVLTPGTINAQAIYLNGTALGGTTGLPLTGGTLTGMLGINLNTAAPASIGANALQHWTGSDNQPAPLYLDAYSTNANHGPVISLRKSAGPAPGITNVNNDLLGAINFQGWVTGVGPQNATAQINARANEPWTATAHGTALHFLVTPDGLTVPREAMTIAANGDWTAHFNGQVLGDFEVGGTFTPSDRRLKKAVKPYRVGLDAVRQLKPIAYEYNGKAGFPADGRTRIGLDANATSEIMPEMVSELGRKLGKLPIKSVSLTGLIFPLLNAIKELADRIEMVEAKLDKLA